MRRTGSGRLRIGDDWNAITIIALSQSNPLKAVAEFIENSIDANARNITITRGREKGAPYLRVTDDGNGIPLDDSGMPNFRYVATHICDSVKRKLKTQGINNIQGEFGIGLLSFWTVGEELILVSPGADEKTYQMRMRKGDPRYTVTQRRTLLPARGTELTIAPLLPGIRHFSGEKIQWYLASELRDRIRNTGVAIEVVDRQARKHFKVEPRQFGGRLLHDLAAPETKFGSIYIEVYLAENSPENRVELHRRGTRVLEDLAALDNFRKPPWTSRLVQGIVDAEFLNLTPGTRSGIVQDEPFAAFVQGMQQIETQLTALIEAQKKAEEAQASKQMLRTIQRAFREALLALPAEEYDWFDVPQRSVRPIAGSAPGSSSDSTGDALLVPGHDTAAAKEHAGQRAFFEFAGPLYSVRVIPGSCQMAVSTSKTFRALARDRARRAVEQSVQFEWQIVEGGGHLEGAAAEIVTFHAAPEPGLCRLQVIARQRDTECQAEALITVTDSLVRTTEPSVSLHRGLPGFTFERAPNDLWRSRFDEGKNLVVVNSAHRDFVYASRGKALKLRYIARLFAKEMVCRNFPGLPAEQLLERMVELSLYTEDNLS